MRHFFVTVAFLLAVGTTAVGCGSGSDVAGPDDSVDTTSDTTTTTTAAPMTTTTTVAPSTAPPTTKPPQRPDNVEELAQQFVAGLLEDRVVEYLATPEARREAAAFLERDSVLDTARAAGRTGQDVGTLTCELVGDVGGTCYVMGYPANDADEANGRFGLWVSYAIYDADEGFTLCDDFVTICNADGSEAAPGAARPIVTGVTDVNPNDS